MRLPVILVGIALAASLNLAVVQADTTTVAAGTTMQGLMEQPLNSSTAQVGQHFYMQLVPPYPNYDNSTWSGSKVAAHVVYVQRAGQGRKPQLGVIIDQIMLRNGAAAKLHADVVSVEHKQGSSLGYAALTTVGGMVVGNILGKWLHTNAGGAVGAVAGALYGINKKSDFTVPSGSRIVFELSRPLTVNTLARSNGHILTSRTNGYKQ